MKKNTLFNKLFEFSKNEVKDIAIELGNDAVETLKNKAIDKSEKLIEEAKNKSTGYIEEKAVEIKQRYSSNITLESENSSSSKKQIISNEMTEVEENEFVDNIATQLTIAGVSAIKNPTEALEVVKTLTNMAGEVRKFQELQITKRMEIDSVRQQALAKIDMQKTILMTYLEKTFDERRDIFNQQFKVIDDALLKGNINQLALGLDSINKLATSSPFKNLASIENVGNALNNKNTQWDF